MSLINIAHPDFRSELLHAAKRRRLVYADQILPPTRTYPEALEQSLTLRDGTSVLVRPIRPDDEPKIKSMCYSFSEQTKYLRYHGILKSMPHHRLQLFCNVDYDTEMALVAVVGAMAQEEIIGVGRYVTTPAKGAAEIALIVRDDWQRKGIGSYLLKRLVRIGEQDAIREFTGYILPENAGMLRTVHRTVHNSGFNTETATENGVVRVTMTVSD